MDEILTIDVTAEDIRDGKPKLCESCPIALAIKRAYPGLPVNVEEEEVVIGEHAYNLPDDVSDAIRAIDYGIPVEPFQFSLTVLDRKYVHDDYEDYE